MSKTTKTKPKAGGADPAPIDLALVRKTIRAEMAPLADAVMALAKLAVALPPLPGDAHDRRLNVVECARKLKGRG